MAGPPPLPDVLEHRAVRDVPGVHRGGADRVVELAAFPAGLVIYWAWNNVLSIAQQWYISSRQGVEIHLVDNIKRQFAPLGRLIGRKPKTETKG